MRSLRSPASEQRPCRLLHKLRPAAEGIEAEAAAQGRQEEAVQAVMHYHGTPITPRSKLLELAGRCFCVSYSDPRDVAVCHQIGQSVMLDNGAFSFWRTDRPTDWPGFYEWCEPWLEWRTTWAVIPDVIDGSEAANDELIDEWPFGARGAPVWHMHESVARLKRLADSFPLICFGSSGEYATLGDARWHRRMEFVFDELCGNGPPPVAVHMLRGLKLCGSEYPFASADSTNIARNHNGNNTRNTAPKDPKKMADEIDAKQCPPRWSIVGNGSGYVVSEALRR